MSKKKILWISDLGVPTGFARVSHSIIKNIKDDYDITGFGINYTGIPHDVGIPIFPAGAAGDPMGYTKIAETVEMEEFDMIFILQDMWVVDNYLHNIREIENLPPIVLYFPVDATCHDGFWYENLDIVTKAVAYNEFGKSVAIKASPDFEFDIISHGVDTDTFKPTFKSRQEAKEILYKNKKDDEKIPEFIILNANRNQPRKRLDLTMRGFAIFAEDKDDVVLYMHCGVLDSSIDVSRLAHELGISSKLLMTNLEKGPQGVSDGHLNLIYNSCDCGVNTSVGEGFGLISVEHAATGAHQIVPRHSACEGLFSDTDADLIPIITDYTLDRIMTVGKLVDKQGVADAMQSAYDKRNNKDFGKSQFEKFTSNAYNWSVISKQWKALFEEAMN